MPQLGFDVFAGSGWQEFTKQQLVCGSYGHLENRWYAQICLKCRAATTLEGRIAASTDIQRNCEHEWDDVTKSCSLCWAKRIDDMEVSNGSER
jgi:hypothetical protein